MKWIVVLLRVFVVVTVLGGETSLAARQRSPSFQSPEQLSLSNGLRVLLGKPVRTALFTEVLLVVRAGTVTPGPRQEEVAWITAEALVCGQRTLSASPIRLELARLGVSLDYTVGREMAVFRFAVPTRNTQRFLQLLEELLERRQLTGEVWDEAVARRQQYQAAEQADVWQRATTQLTGLIWKVGSEAPLGHPPLLKRRAGGVDRAALAAFWKHAYAPGNMVLSIWGEQPIVELARSVEQEFGHLIPDSEPASAEVFAEPLRSGNGGVRCLQLDTTVPAALIMGVGSEMNSDRAFYAWQIAAHILGASYNSRLQRRLRTEAQVVYTVEASIVPVGARSMTLRVACQTDQVAATRRIILEELRKLTTEAVTQQELDLARALLRSRLKLDGASFRDQFYRRSLVLLSSQNVRDPGMAEPVLASFTPATLLDALSATLKPEESSTVVVSARAEPLCEGSYEPPL
jgi:predicted Zn-dependent peptidase